MLDALEMLIQRIIGNLQFMEIKTTKHRCSRKAGYEKRADKGYNNDTSEYFAFIKRHIINTYKIHTGGRNRRQASKI